MRREPVDDQRDAQRTHAGHVAPTRRPAGRWCRRGRPGTAAPRTPRPLRPRAMIAIARCSRGLRPANNVTAAARVRDQDGKRRQAPQRELLIASPRARAGASSSSGSSVSAYDSVAPSRSSSTAPADFSERSRDAGVLGIVADLLGSRQPIRAVGQRQHERGDAHRDDDGGQDHALRQRIGGGRLTLGGSAADRRIARRPAGGEDQHVHARCRPATVPTAFGSGCVRAAGTPRR